jgi:hypothetical protein
MVVLERGAGGPEGRVGVPGGPPGAARGLPRYASRAAPDQPHQDARGEAVGGAHEPSHGGLSSSKHGHSRAVPQGFHSDLALCMNQEYLFYLREPLHAVASACGSATEAAVGVVRRQLPPPVCGQPSSTVNFMKPLELLYSTSWVCPPPGWGWEELPHGVLDRPAELLQALVGDSLRKARLAVTYGIAAEQAGEGGEGGEGGDARAGEDSAHARFLREYGRQVGLARVVHSYLFV